MGDDALVASAESLEGLHSRLQSEEHEPVLIRRIPLPDESLFLGAALELRLL